MNLINKENEEWKENSATFLSTKKAMYNFVTSKGSSGSLFLDGPSTAKTLSISNSIVHKNDNSQCSKPNYQIRRMSSSSILTYDSEILNAQGRAALLPKPKLREKQIVQEFTVDPYRILGVTRNATDNEVRRNYLRLSLLNHPHRKHPSSDQLTMRIRRWKFIALAASYETLSNMKYRTNYNVANRYSGTMNCRLKSKETGGIWKVLKKSLEISDRDEKTLDHDGVQCCAHDSVFSQFSSADNFGTESRDDDEDLFGMPSHFRNNSDNTTNTDVSADDLGGQQSDHLFGGVLGPLYKARNHEGFTDSFELFCTVSGSNIFRFDSAFKNQEDTFSNQFNIIAQNWMMESTPTFKSDQFSHRQTRSLIDDDCANEDGELLCKSTSTTIDSKLIYPSLPTLPKNVLVALCNEFPLCNRGEQSITTKTTNEVRGRFQVTVTTKTRQCDDQILVRTEKVTKNLKSGKRKTNIEVKRFAAPVHVEVDEENDYYYNSCFSNPFSDFFSRCN
jgi:curved DNA-binding protein CbpA